MQSSLTSFFKAKDANTATNVQSRENLTVLNQSQLYNKRLNNFVSFVHNGRMISVGYNMMRMRIICGVVCAVSTAGQSRLVQAMHLLKGLTISRYIE